MSEKARSYPAGSPLEGHWRLVIDGGFSGASNMARDEALALSTGRRGASTLRVYRFQPPAISIGRFQDINRGIDLDACREQGVDVVRRPSGGLAMLHADDFTYSVTLPIDESDLAAKKRCFALVAEGIVESLSRLGVTSVVVAHGGGVKTASAWCLESAFGVDIEFDGRKICGSAQRVFHGAMLQHGTLFLRENRRLLEAVTDSPPGRRAHPPLATLDEACGREITWGEVAGAFSVGFSSGLGVKLEPVELSDEELSLACRLEEEKYRSVE